jgi:hypothetical protein
MSLTKIILLRGMRLCLYILGDNEYMDGNIIGHDVLVFQVVSLRTSACPPPFFEPETFRHTELGTHPSLFWTSSTFSLTVAWSLLKGVYQIYRGRQKELPDLGLLSSQIGEFFLPHPVFHTLSDIGRKNPKTVLSSFFFTVLFLRVITKGYIKRKHF